MRRRRWHGERKLRRVWVSYDLGAINRPRLHFAAEEHDSGEWGYVAVSYGNGNSDPVVNVEVNLGGTRVGHWIFLVYWTVSEWIDGRRKAPAAP